MHPRPAVSSSSSARSRCSPPVRDEGGDGDGMTARQEAATSPPRSRSTPTPSRPRSRTTRTGSSVEPDEAQCMGDAVMAGARGGALRGGRTSRRTTSSRRRRPAPASCSATARCREEQADAIIDGWEDDCVDLVAMLGRVRPASEFDLDPDGEECFADGLGRGRPRRPRCSPAPSPARDGTPDDDDGRGLLRPPQRVRRGRRRNPHRRAAIAESLAEDGSLTAEQARVPRRRASSTSSGRSAWASSSPPAASSDLDAEAQDEVTGALLQAAGGL